MKKNRIMLIAAAVFTLVASFVASSACLWGWYQPEEPASLRNK